MDLPCHYKPSIWGTPIYGNLHICSCKTNICPLFLNPSLVSPGEKKINQNDGLYLKNLTKQILKTSIKAMQILEDPWKPPPFSQEKPMIFQGTFHDSSTSDSSTCRNSWFRIDLGWFWIIFGWFQIDLGSFFLRIFGRFWKNWADFEGLRGDSKIDFGVC